MTDDKADPAIPQADDVRSLQAGAPSVGAPSVGAPSVGAPSVGAPSTGELPMGERPGVDQAAGSRTQAPTSLAQNQAGRPARTGRKTVYLVPDAVGAAEVDLGNRPTVSVLDDGEDAYGAADETEVDGAEADGRAVDGSDVDDSAGDDSEHRDWEWVEEWRAAHEPTPWATGLFISGFAAMVVGVAIWVLCAGLADRPVIAILVNLLVAAGLAPAMWLCRGLPVLRWIAAGALLGVVGGWIAAIVMLPLPLA